jgi:hypothetical protein
LSSLAEKHYSWQLAMFEEINSVKNNRASHLVPLSPSHKAIGLKWVYKVKKNVVGEVVKYKA